MSESGHESRNWRMYIQDMIEFSNKVLLYTEGLNQNAFISDGRTYDATLRNLQLIGEAAMQIPATVREAHQEIPWRNIIGTRN